MCMSCGKSAVRAAGITLLTILLLLSLGAIIFSSVNYEDTNLPSFYNLQLKPLSIAQITFVFYCLMLGIFGYFVFFLPNTCLYIIYSLLVGIGIVTLGVVGGLSFIADKRGWVSDYLGCNTQWEGLKRVYDAVDVYVQHVDQALCSPKCKCNFDYETISYYKANQTLATYFNQWHITDDQVNSANEFRHCPNSTKDEAYAHTAAENSHFKQYAINLDKFFNYMEEMEREYRCAGFCQTKYYNTYIQSEVIIAKYLFTDINKGPPAHLGCMDQFVKRIPSYIMVIGSICLFLSAFLIVIFILTICLCCMKSDTTFL